MMIQRKKYVLCIVLLVLLFIPTCIKPSATVTSVSIKAPSTIVGYNKNLKLTANVTGATENDLVTWSTSNPLKATVDENGVVTGTGGGKVKITASCGGQAATVEILAVRYSASSGAGDLSIYYNGNKKRTFRTYRSSDYNESYGKKFGSPDTATATVLSAYVNFFITPDTVHNGSNHYSETYAVRKLGNNYSKQDTCPSSQRLSTLGNVMPTNLMTNRILSNSGLKTSYVRKVTSSSYQQIYNHLANGNAVMFTTNNASKYKGISFSSSSKYTTMVMAGLDENGKVLLLNSQTGSINYTHVQKKTFHFTVNEIVKNYIKSCKSATKFYSGDYNGYILVYAPASTEQVRGMRISRSNYKMDKGDTFTLSAYINPATVDQSVVWSSSNEAVATVSPSGKVTAVSPGKAVIKAVSLANESYKCSCNITVYPGQITSVKVTAPKKLLSYGKKMQLSLNVVGGTKNDKVVWFSSNTNKAKVDKNGVVTAVGGGYVNITGKVGAKSDTVTILANRYSPTDVNGDKTITIYYDGLKKRVYKSYSQTAFNGSYGGNRGCAITSTAIILSAMVDSSITPETCHRGTGKYSERYAIKKLGAKYRNYDTISATARINKLDQSTPTNRLMAEIFANAGLKTKYVRDITSGSAKEIYENLAKGNPVLFTTKSSLSYKGISLARTWHTLVMVGIDAYGKAIVINPAGGKVNYSHAQKQYFHFSVEEIVSHYMRDCQGSSTDYYSGSRYGYVIVYK